MKKAFGLIIIFVLTLTISCTRTTYFSENNDQLVFKSIDDSVLTLNQKVINYADNSPLDIHFGFNSKDSLIIDSFTFEIPELKTKEVSLFYLSEEGQVLHGATFKSPFSKIDIKKYKNFKLEYSPSDLPDEININISFTVLRQNKIIKHYSFTKKLSKTSTLEKIKPGVC